MKGGIWYSVRIIKGELRLKKQMRTATVTWKTEEHSTNTNIVITGTIKAQN